MKGSNMVNKEIVKLINEWDPLGFGPGSYDVEAVDVLQAAFEMNDSKHLAKRIQFIYEFSFEEHIPLTECRKVAKRVLELKKTAQYRM